MFHVSALHWAPFSFSLEHFLNPSHPLLYQFPSPMSSQRAINFSCQYIALGSLQFFLRLHAKPLLPPIIPGFHPPVLPQAIHVSCQCVAPTSSLFTLSCMLLSLLILSPCTYPYFFKQYDDFEMQINIGKGVNMASITTNLMIIVVVKSYFGL